MTGQIGSYGAPIPTELKADRTDSFEQVQLCLTHMEREFLSRFQQSSVMVFGAIPNTNLDRLRPLVEGGGLLGTADFGPFTKAERLDVIAAFERTLAQARTFVEGLPE